MAVPIRMPDLGTVVEEFPFMSWMVNEGDTIALGDPLAEIETDKAVTLLESPAKGVLLKQVAVAGTIVHTGDIVAYVGVAGEVIADDLPEQTAPAAATQVVEAPVQPGGKSSLVAPVVRNLAAKLGVDLALVQGTGVNGVITREDVMRTSKGGVVTMPAPAAIGERLSRGQVVVARNVVKSWTEIPHLYMSASVDMTAAQRVREESAKAGKKISYDALILQAMAKAIMAMPLIGSKLDGERIIPMKGLHLALAIGIENELFLPVIRDIDKKSLPALQDEINETVSQVKAKAIPAERMSGGCMALSNLGMYPVDEFDPIIFPEHSAIMTVGAIMPTPVAVNGFIGVRPIMKVRLAVDHRLINGRTAAEFISKIKENLESV